MRRSAVVLPIGVLALASLLSMSCGGEDEETSSPKHKPKPKPKPDASAGCIDGELLDPSGACRTVGVPPDACGPGFSPTGDGGCNAVLPPAACPPGQMAVPGDTVCREVAPCGEGTWGSIPTEANTTYVDKSFAGATSDGSQAKPYKTLKEAYAAAAPGAIIAIAEGSYSPILHIENKPVRLWGKCPALVEVRGGIEISPKANGTEVHDLAVTGSGPGMAISGSLDVLVDRVWIHDVTLFGIGSVNVLGATRVTVSRSLVENAHANGIGAGGVEMTIEGSHVRGTLWADESEGLWAGKGSKVTVRGSLVEQNFYMNVLIVGAEMTMEGTVVRDGIADENGVYGRGITLGPEEDGTRAKATVVGSVFERNIEISIAAFESDVTIERCTVRDTLPQPSDRGIGDGIYLQSATAAIRGSVVERSRYIGAYVLASAATFEHSIVRDTQASQQGDAGDGISVNNLYVANVGGIKDVLPASATITASWIQGSARAGLSNFATTVALGSTAFACNGIDLDGENLADPPLAFAFDNSGDLACGCGDDTMECQVQSATLTPPGTF